MEKSQLLKRYYAMDLENRRYLENLAGHLSAAGEEARDRLYLLINKPWMDLKFEAHRSYRSFATDVEIAIQAAQGDDTSRGLVQRIRNTLLYTSLGALAANVPIQLLEALVYLGHASQAMDLATLRLQDAEQAWAYLAIAKACQEYDQKQYTREALSYTWQTALMTTNETMGVLMPERRQIFLLVEVAEAFIKLGDRSTAIKAANMALAQLADIANCYTQSQILVRLAAICGTAVDSKLLAEIARFAAGLEPCDNGDESPRMQALLVVSAAYSKMGDLDIAASYQQMGLRFAEQIPDPVLKAAALRKEAEFTQPGEEARQHFVDFLRLLADPNQDDFEFNRALSTFVEEGASLESERLREIAQRAAPVAENIREPAVKAEALAWIAVLLERSRDVVQAQTKLRTVVNIFQSEMSDNEINLNLNLLLPILLHLTSPACTNEVIEPIKKLILGIKYPQRCAELLMTVADIALSAGESELAVTTIHQAHGQAEKIETGAERATTFSSLAKVAAIAGELTLAENLADWVVREMQQFPPEINRLQALKSGAKALIQAGERGRGMVLFAEMIEETRGIDEFFRTDFIISVVQPKNEVIDKEILTLLKAVAENIVDQNRKVEVLCAIALAYSELGQEDQAYELVQQLSEIISDFENENRYAEAVASSVLMLARMGYLAQLRDFLIETNQFQENYAVRTIITAIIRALAEVGEQDFLGHLLRALNVPDSNPYTKQECFLELARAFAKLGDTDRASQSAELAVQVFNSYADKDPIPRAETLIAASAAAAQVGNVNLAILFAEQAVVTAQRIGDGTYKRGLVAAGEPEESVTKAAKLSEIALIFDQIGNARRGDEVMKAVQDTLRWIQNEKSIADAVIAVSESLAQMDRPAALQQILGAASKIAQPSRRAEVLGKLADSLAVKEDHAPLYQIMAMAEALENDSSQNRVARVQLYHHLLAGWAVRKYPVDIYTLWKSAFDTLYRTDRWLVYKTVELLVPWMASLEDGEYLVKMFDAIREVDSWWSHS